MYDNLLKSKKCEELRKEIITQMIKALNQRPKDILITSYSEGEYTRLIDKQSKVSVDINTSDPEYLIVNKFMVDKEYDISIKSLSFQLDQLKKCNDI